MSERVIYEYSILRYVPDLERGEFINVGLVMMCKRARWIRCELKIDAARIRALAPEADIQCLEHQLAAFQGCDIPTPSLPVEERYRWMVAAKSAIIQASPSHPGLIEASTLDTKFEALFQRLIC